MLFFGVYLLHNNAPLISVESSPVATQLQPDRLFSPSTDSAVKPTLQSTVPVGGGCTLARLQSSEATADWARRALRGKGAGIG